jgi:hypothetical protein
MQETWKFKSALFTFLLLAVALAPSGASAITAELAKQCNVLLGKQFPPREAGNPAAGSARGNGQAERDFFKKCVENNGKMDDANAPAPASPAQNTSPAPKAK